MARVRCGTRGCKAQRARWFFRVNQFYANWVVLSFHIPQYIGKSSKVSSSLFEERLERIQIFSANSFIGLFCCFLLNPLLDFINTFQCLIERGLHKEVFFYYLSSSPAPECRTTAHRPPQFNQLLTIGCTLPFLTSGGPSSTRWSSLRAVSFQVKISCMVGYWPWTCSWWCYSWSRKPRRNSIVPVIFFMFPLSLPKIDFLRLKGH